MLDVVCVKVPTAKVFSREQTTPTCETDEARVFVGLLSPRIENCYLVLSYLICEIGFKVGGLLPFSLTYFKSLKVA